MTRPIKPECDFAILKPAIGCALCDGPLRETISRGVGRAAVGPGVHRGGGQGGGNDDAGRGGEVESLDVPEMGAPTLVMFFHLFRGRFL